MLEIQLTYDHFRYLNGLINADIADINKRFDQARTMVTDFGEISKWRDENLKIARNGAKALRQLFRVSFANDPKFKDDKAVQDFWAGKTEE